jgi:CelD/BcsL family acetyltransferase involved in cellulose biosynthesis
LLEQTFNFLSQEYADLFCRSSATAFQHPLWLHNLYGKLVEKAGAEPLIITARSASDRRLVMVLPLIRQRHGLVRTVEFADLGVSDYAEPVCDRETFLRIVQDKDARRQIRERLAPFDLIRIKKLRDGRLPLEELLMCAKPVPMDMSAHAVTLKPSFTEWRSNSMSRSYQKELDKKKRQLVRKGAYRFECSQDPDAIRTAFKSMREYRQPRFQNRDKGEGDLMQRPVFFDFYLELALAGRGDFTRTYIMWMDDRPIAVALGLAHAKHLLVVLGGFDLEGFKNQSVGALMFEEVAGDCISRSDLVLDFTIGDEPYKRLYGAEASAMWTISAAGSSIGSISGFMVDHMPWIKDMAKKLLSKQSQTETQPG